MSDSSLSNKKIDKKKKNVFIGWSGPSSKELANNLREWLPSVINEIRPWMSDMDITKGQRWRSELANQLKDTKIGIICLASENLNSQWLHFEAGALSKTINDVYICPYLLPLRSGAKITGPLAEFQHTRVEKEDTRRLMHTINNALGKSLDDEQLNEYFNNRWPEFEEKLKKIKDSSTTEIQPSDREILEYLYNHVNKVASLLENSSLANVSSNRKGDEKDQIEKIMIDLASDYKGIKEAKYDDYIKGLYIREAEIKIWDVIERINNIKNGHLYVSRENGLHILLELIENTQKSFFATSIIPFRDFWFSDFGKRYFTANENIRKKGVEIKRIFIKHDNLSDEEEERYNNLIKKQKESGIEVKEAERRVLTEEFLKDFAILDNKLVFYLHFKDPDKNYPNPTIDHADIYINPYKISEASKIFNDIYAHSHDDIKNAHFKP